MGSTFDRLILLLMQPRLEIGIAAAVAGLLYALAPQ